MSEATSYKIHCAECLMPVPDEAHYCPHCGRTVMASTRADRVRKQFGEGIAQTDEGGAETSIWGDLRDLLGRFDGETVVAVAIFTGFLFAGIGLTWFAVGSAGGSIEAGSILDGVVFKKMTARAEAGASGEAAENRAEGSQVEVGTFSYEVGRDERTDHRTALVEHDGSGVLRLYTPKSTGYESLENRTMAISMRLEWMARRHVELVRAGKRPAVEHRKRGDNWEVVWTDGAATYRLLRVTSEDVRHWNQLPDQKIDAGDLAGRYAREVGALLSKVADSDSKV